MPDPIVYSADIHSETVFFSLSDVCERCGVTTEIIIEMVEHGIIAPAPSSPQNALTFGIDTLARLSRAQRLRDDLELVLPGLALGLELLDRIDELEREIASLKQQLRK